MKKRCSFLLGIFILVIILSVSVFATSDNPVFRSTKIWSEESAGPHIFFVSSIDIAITEVRFDSTTDLINAKLIIESQTTVPQGLHDLNQPYQYITLGKFGINDNEISNVLLKFRVEKSWVDNNSEYKLININIYENDWEEVKTTYLFNDSKYYYYEANIDKLSYLAINGKEKKITAATSTTKESAKSVINPLTPVISQVPKTKNETSLLDLFFSPERNNYLFLILLGGIVIFIIIFASFLNIILKNDYIENKEEIQKFIEEELAEGIPRKEIEKELVNEGWPRKLVDKLVHDEKLPHDTEIKLKSYILSMKNKMFSDEQIKVALIKEGWAEDSISELITESSNF